MSFYYGGIGHYMANTMVMFTLVVVVYTMVALAVFNEEGVNGRPLHPEGVMQLLLSGMGILQTMPLLVTLTVEKGVWQALSDVGFMILSGGPLYFIFHIETKSYYFSQTLMAGGAMYRPTGRGFVTQHSSFDENFRFFASSHIYLGFELFIALILFGIYTTSKQYAGLTWSLWMTVASFLLGPFWFNPLSFEWNRIKDDYIRWTSWMAERGGTSEQAWDAWWKEETKFYGELSLSWKLFLAIQRVTPWVLIAIGIAGSTFIHSWEEQARVLELLGVFAVFIFANWVIFKLERSWSYPVRRFTTIFVWTVTGCVLARLYLAHVQYVRYSVSLYYIAAAATFSILLTGFHAQASIMCKLHDYVVGHSIFAILTILAVLQVHRLAYSKQIVLSFLTMFFLSFSSSVHSWATSRRGCCTTTRSPREWRSTTSSSTRAALRTSWASCARRWRSSRSSSAALSAPAATLAALTWARRRAAERRSWCRCSNAPRPQRRLPHHRQADELHRPPLSLPSPRTARLCLLGLPLFATPRRSRYVPT
jgi:callose synthase